MSKWLEKRSTFTIAVAAIAVLMVFGTGTAVAGGLITSAKIKNNTIQSIDVRTNTLRSSDVRNGSLTGADVADRSLTNQDLAIYYATVEADATIVDQSGGVTATTTVDPGEFAVDFGRDIRGCAFSATIGDPEDSSETGQVNVADRGGNIEAVYVQTRSNDGSVAVAHSFHLIVVC